MCEIDIGNPKCMTFTKLFQVRNFITFELKVIRHEEREIQSFYADCFYICPKPRTALHLQHPIWKLLVWPQQATKVNLSIRTQELNSLLFLKSQKFSAHASGVWHHSHPLVLFPIWGFILTSMNDVSSPHVREHRRSYLHLTNPCTEPKGSHPN